LSCWVLAYNFSPYRYRWYRIYMTGLIPFFLILSLFQLLLLPCLYTNISCRQTCFSRLCTPDSVSIRRISYPKLRFLGRKIIIVKRNKNVSNRKARKDCSQRMQSFHRQSKPCVLCALLSVLCGNRVLNPCAPFDQVNQNKGIYLHKYNNNDFKIHNIDNYFLYVWDG
jgi:hypothetical protein